MTTDAQLTAELENMIEQIKGGREVAITLERNLFGGSTFTRFEYPKYGGNGQRLKPEKALSCVIVGDHVQTLRMLIAKLEGE